MPQETVIGLNVHADSITAAILPPKGDTPEVVKLSGDLMEVRRFFRLTAHDPPAPEAGARNGRML